MSTAAYSPEDNKIRIDPSSRLDADEYARAKAAGYRWAPMQKIFFAVWSPGAEDFALELCGEIGDEDKSLVERAEERADRFETYSDNRKQEADRAHAAVSAIADNIPFGQPILVGHHSERHARRDAEKIENGMRKAVNAWKTSQYWRERAAGALAHAKYKERPDVRGRRIKTLESEIRKRIARYTPETTKDRPKPQMIMQQKWSETYPHGKTLSREEREAIPEKAHVWCGSHGRGGQWVAVEDLEGIKKHQERWIEHLSNRLEYEAAMLKEEIGVDDHRVRFDYAIGGKITVRRESSTLTILKLNRKDDATVSVSTNSKRWTRVVPVEDILSYEPPAEGAAEQIKAATKRTGPCNYPGEGFATCTLAEWKKIGKDYKSTIHRIEATEAHAAHYVRWAIGVYLTLPAEPTGDSTQRSNYRHSYYAVYITDEKRKDPPPIDAQPPQPPVPPIESKHPTAEQINNQINTHELQRQTREARQAEDAPFVALQEALKTAVQVVAAPQLFVTPHDIAQQVAELADIRPDSTILEPSAGTGALINGIYQPHGRLVAIEINVSLAERLRQILFGKEEVICADFLECSPEIRGTFDRIIMNPPFEHGADIKHIEHAKTFLKPGGRLVAICANGSRQNEKYDLQPLPAGSFKESGTMVNAAIYVYYAPASEKVFGCTCGAEVPISERDEHIATCNGDPDTAQKNSQVETVRHNAAKKAWETRRKKAQESAVSQA